MLTPENNIRRDEWFDFMLHNLNSDDVIEK